MGPQEPAATLSTVPSSATASVMAVNLGGEGVAGSKNNLMEAACEEDEGREVEGKKAETVPTDSIEDTVEASEEERRSRENTGDVNNK